MKNLFKKKASLQLGFTVFCIFLSMIKGYAQDPGDSPDGPPPAVPFSDYAPLILLAIGIVFSIYVLRKVDKKMLNKNI